MEWTKCEQERDAAIAKLEEVTKERDAILATHFPEGFVRAMNELRDREMAKLTEERDALRDRLREADENLGSQGSVINTLRSELQVARALLDSYSAERDKFKARLDFLKEKGITVGMMKTSAKPDPYLVYLIEYGSEMCDMRTLNKLIDAEIERDTAIKERDEARMLLETMTHSQIEIDKERDQVSDLLDEATTKCERGLCAGAALFAGAGGTRIRQLNDKLVQTQERLGAALLAGEKDKARLDWLEQDDHLTRLWDAPLKLKQWNPTPLVDVRDFIDVQLKRSK